MKFALLVTNLSGGGAEGAMLRMARALRARSHRAVLILIERHIQHALAPGLEVHCLSERASKGALGTWLAARRLRRLYRSLDLGEDCVSISTLPFADAVAVRAGLPRLWCRITNTLSAEIDALRSTDPRKAARRLARYRDLYEGRPLIAVSDGVAQDLRDRLALSKARIVRIYNGFDLQRIEVEAAAADPALPKAPFVLHVGRFMPQKRHDLLLQAWQSAGLPHTLVLLTEPSAALARLVARHGLGDRVVIAGFQRNPYAWMRRAELLVLCSDREGMPNVLVEALAAGTRVVSTDCPSGPREVLRGALARWLVPCGDAAALAAAMHAALASPRPGREAVPVEFSEEHMAAELEALDGTSAGR
jgi:glycosyltransferase involved in cell wall biosynthesis